MNKNIYCLLEQLLRMYNELININIEYKLIY